MSKHELIDVTKEFLCKATPGKGSVEYEEGFDFRKHAEEKQTALWLLDTFGGRIIVLKENYGYKLKNPDYKWNSRFWELKGVSSRSSLENALKKAIKQIDKNTGGIIIETQKLHGKLDFVYGTIIKRLDSPKINDLYIIIKNRKMLVKVYRKK